MHKLLLTLFITMIVALITSLFRAWLGSYFEWIKDSHIVSMIQAAIIIATVMLLDIKLR